MNAPVSGDRKRIPFSLSVWGYLLLLQAKIMYFIEIKIVSKPQRNKARKTAIKQLFSTIVKFKERIDFSSYSLRAVYSLTNSNAKSFHLSLVRREIIS